MKKYSHLIFLFIILFIFIKCKRKDGDYYWEYKNYFKLLGFELSQNLNEDNNSYPYDTVKYKISIMIDNDFLSNHGDIYFSRHAFSLFDYYKSINIISINSFNSEYQNDDTISDLFSLTYYDEIYYTSNTIAQGPTLIVGHYIDSTFYEHSSDLLNNNNCCHAYPFKLQLNIPPDTTVLFQFKIDIELLDGRQFELYSVPVYIKP